MSIFTRAATLAEIPTANDESLTIAVADRTIYLEISGALGGGSYTHINPEKARIAGGLLIAAADLLEKLLDREAATR